MTDVGRRRQSNEDHSSTTSGRREEALAQMGTTAVAMRFAADHVALAHVGDSRAYLVRRGTIRQLTEDHSVVAEFVRDAGERADASDEESTSSSPRFSRRTDRIAQVDALDAATGGAGTVPSEPPREEATPTGEF